jgi:hypothetical protein
MSIGSLELRLDETRSVGSVVSTALRCYVARAAFFMTITATVVVPWALVIWLVTGRGLLDQRSGGSGDALLSLGISGLIVGPLVSALHVHALSDLGSGERPRLVPVLRRGILALPLVAAAQVAADLGSFAGVICLIIPGVILSARWILVPQIAAVERPNWIDCLRHSWRRTHGLVLHILGVVLAVTVPLFVINRVIALLVPDRTDALTLVVGVAVELISISIVALTQAVLYYDIQARQSAPMASASALPERDGEGR